MMPIDALKRMRQQVEIEKGEALQRIDVAEEVMRRRGFECFGECIVAVRKEKEARDYVARTLEEHIKSYEGVTKAVSNIQNIAKVSTPFRVTLDLSEGLRQAQVMFDHNQEAYHTACRDFNVLKSLCQHEFEHRRCKFCGIEE